MELAEQYEDWPALEKNALRLMGVNPLTAHPHKALATAAERNHDSTAAIAAYGSLLTLSPDDPSLIHFRLATHLSAAGKTELAKRHVLQALENAPRYRDAQRLLLELTRTESKEL